MSNNNALEQQLADIRRNAADAAKQAAATPTEPKPLLRNKSLNGKKPGRRKEPEARPPEGYDRATITLKPRDTQIIQEIQLFLMKQGHKAPPVATLMRLAMHYTHEALKDQAEAVTSLYLTIVEDDGRKQKQ